MSSIFFLCAHVPPKKVFAGIKTRRAFSIYSSNVFFPFLSAAYAIVILRNEFLVQNSFHSPSVKSRTVYKGTQSLEKLLDPVITHFTSSHLSAFPFFLFSRPHPGLFSI